MCTDFIILKGLYIKKKTNKEKKNKEKNSQIYRTHHSLYGKPEPTCQLLIANC